MDRAKFYAALRKRDSGVFGTSLSQQQVTGINAKLDIWERYYAKKYPDTYFAAAMGQAYRETGGKMVPVLETYASTRQQAAARLENAFRKGQLTWVKTPYWYPDSTGKIAVGGGDIQLTHPYNYRKANDRLEQVFGVDYGLDRDYDKILDPKISAHVLFLGMIEGWWRGGKKLSNYEGKNGRLDYFNARDIVNGDKNKKDRGSRQTVGELVSMYSKAFENAVDAGGGFEPTTAQQEQIDKLPDVVEVPEPQKPPQKPADEQKPIPAPSQPKPPVSQPQGKSGGKAGPLTAIGGLIVIAAVWFRETVADVWHSFLSLFGG